jgi:hypothetical protein
VAVATSRRRRFLPTELEALREGECGLKRSGLRHKA